MREEYKGNIQHQRYLLTVLRPFHGYNATGPDVNKLTFIKFRDLIKSNRAGDGTYGIDSFLIVLRMVLYYARTLDLPPNATPNKKMFEKMAWKTMGWAIVDDHLMKEEIIKKLLHIDAVTPEIMEGVDLTFEALYNRDDLKNLLKESKVLQTISRMYITRPKDNADAIWENAILNPEDLRRMNDLRTDEKVGIPSLLHNKFHQEMGDKKLRFFFHLPTFICVKFEPKECSDYHNHHQFTINHQVVIEKEDGELPVLVTKQDYVYQLVASVRLSGERYDKEGMKVVDDVRTYWIDGQPIDTRNVGTKGYGKEIHMEKEYTEAGNKRWSIGEPGRYLLFYTIVILADGVPNSVFDKKFPEFIRMFQGKKSQRQTTTQSETSGKA